MALKILREYFPLESHSMDRAGKEIILGKHKEHARLVKNSDKLAHLKLDMRAAWNYLVDTPNLLDKYVIEFGRRLKVSKQFNSFEAKNTTDELAKYLWSKKTLDLKSERNDGHVWGKNIGKPITGKKARLILDQLWKVDEDAVQIRGQIGNKGVVRGFVKKIIL